MLVIEQNARTALSWLTTATSWAGRIMLEDSAARADNPDVKEFYLGVGGESGTRSYRDVKHYRRRKRWL